MGEFRRQLKYKCQWNRKHLVAIDRFFPSSKMCNAAVRSTIELTLSDREWDCGVVRTISRDILAACNLRDEGLRILAVGQTERSKRSGSQCKTRQSGLLSLN